MEISVSRRDTCRLCLSRNIELVFKLNPSPPAEDYVPASRLKDPQPAYPLDLFFCHDCTHVQLLDVVDPDFLFTNYIYTSASSPDLKEHFRRYAGSLKSRFNPPAGSLAVDVGSNDGLLLGFLKAGGLRVLGVDPAREIARKATENGIPTLAHFLTPKLAAEMRDQHGTAFFVTANNSFAHTDNMGDLADAIQMLLAPEGVFVFEVSYLVDLVQGMVFDFIYHEHLCYHSVKSLGIFLRHHGLELIDIERIATKGGSLRVTAQLVGSRRPASPCVAEFIALEEKLKFDRAETFKIFAQQIAQKRAELVDLLKNLKAQEKTIAGYGASATVTTLLYHFELGSFIDFLVDDYEVKQGRYSPGLHLPVLSPAMLYEKRPDYVVVLAWRFSDLIIRRHQAFLDQGGTFILPLPQLKIISQRQLVAS